MLTDSVVVEQPMPVAKVDALRNGIHFLLFRGVHFSLAWGPTPHASGSRLPPLADASPATLPGAVRVGMAAGASNSDIASRRHERHVRASLGGIGLCRVPRGLT